MSSARGDYWCATAVNGNGEYMGQWATCAKECPLSTTSLACTALNEDGSSGQPSPCIFPALIDDVESTACRKDHGSGE